MRTTDAFAGLSCVDCEATFDPGTVTHRCPECNGHLDPAYEYDGIELARADLDARPSTSLWRYEELLPFDPSEAVTMSEGATPLVECPTLAEELSVGRVLVKDEGRNPTGATVDRGLSVSVTAAASHGASDVALASTGIDGQAAAAYAARVGLDAHVFLPARSTYVTKAMVNVHGGDMTIVGGRFGDAVDTYRTEAVAHDEWYELSPFVEPYRREGAKTVFFEVVEQLGWEVPEAIVVPTGSGVGIAGIYRGAREFRRLGLTTDLPRLYATQSAGCAPIAAAFERGLERHEAWETPDTICGDLEIPDPEGGQFVLDAVGRSEGSAVATDDDAILEAGVVVAESEGVELGAAGAGAASGAWTLAENGELDGDDTVVLVNTKSAAGDADLFRSHLMGQGI